MQPLTLIGYFPKKIVQWPDWLKTADITAIRSVSECISAGPKDWVRHWTHNERGVWSTIAAALAVVPQAERAHYELHAYRMLPRKWDNGRETAIVPPPLNVEPMPNDFHIAGFDVVSIEAGVVGFGHSPLSCNSMAEEIATNKNCLLHDLDTAMRTALDFSRFNPEPGPYYVVEVLWRDIKALSSNLSHLD